MLSHISFIFHEFTRGLQGYHNFCERDISPYFNFNKRTLLFHHLQHQYIPPKVFLNLQDPLRISLSFNCSSNHALTSSSVKYLPRRFFFSICRTGESHRVQIWRIGRMGDNFQAQFRCCVSGHQLVWTLMNRRIVLLQNSTQQLP